MLINTGAIIFTGVINNLIDDRPLCIGAMSKPIDPIHFDLV